MLGKWADGDHVATAQKTNNQRNLREGRGGIGGDGRRKNERIPAT